MRGIRQLGCRRSMDSKPLNIWCVLLFGILKVRFPLTMEFLEMFLRNLLLNEHHPLYNRALHISGTFKDLEKANIDSRKANIEEEKANIEEEKVNIEGIFTSKTASNVRKLKEAFGIEFTFGRSDVERVLSLKPTRSSALLREMAEQGVIEPVIGHGKGKYRFR